MKNLFYILILGAFSFGASPMSDGGALGWYGYDSLLSSELYMTNNADDDNDDSIQRKRRHRRRRKIGPARKGW